MLSFAQDIIYDSFDATENVVFLSKAVFPGSRESPDGEFGFHNLAKRLPFLPVDYG